MSSVSSHWMYARVYEGTVVQSPFVVRVNDRDNTVAALNREGIGAGIHYPTPLYRQPAFARAGYSDISLPVSDEVASQVLSLPIYPEMTESQVDRVATALMGVVRS